MISTLVLLFVQCTNNILDFFIFLSFFFFFVFSSPSANDHPNENKLSTRFIVEVILEDKTNDMSLTPLSRRRHVALSRYGLLISFSSLLARLLNTRHVVRFDGDVLPIVGEERRSDERREYTREQVSWKLQYLSV